MVYGSEIWPMREMNMKKLNTWKKKTLRSICGSLVDQGIWSIRTNQKLRELHKDLDIVADIKNKKLDGIGHLERIDMER